MRIAAGPIGEPDHLEQLGDLLLGLGRAGQAETDVARDGEMREEVAFLWHIADPASLGRDEVRGVVDDLVIERSPTRVCARSKPQMTRSKVVLPLPDGPRIEVIVPASTRRSTPVSTGFAPNPLTRSAPSDQAGHMHHIRCEGRRSNHRPRTRLGTAAMPIISSAKGAAWL